MNDSNHHQKIAILFANYGPYHVARVKAAYYAAQTKGWNVCGIELARSENEYPWKTKLDEIPFPIYSAINDVPLETVKFRDLFTKLIALLNQNNPDAIAISGYARPAMLIALLWCLYHRKLLFFCQKLQNMITSFFNKTHQDLQKAQEYLERLTNLNSTTISSIQLHKFQSIWEDCISDVPYYRELVEKGKAPGKISSWEDFYAIPVLDRITIQNNPEKFHRLSTSPDSYISTTGSTGQPVQLGIWKSESNILRIAKLVPWIQLGYTANSSLYLIWGHAHLLGNGWHRYWNHAVRKLKDWLLNYYRVDAYTLNPLKAKKVAKEIIQKKPSGLIGYAAILDLLCRYSQEYHLELRNVGLKFVMSCAEPPPREDTFELIRTVFNCPILQEFGGVDFGHVGFKIDDNPYTLFPDLNILESELGNKNNNTCSALVTTLYHRYVPLIRYQQGDILTGVVRNQHGFIISFQEQIGRINDMIFLSDGSSVHSVALLHCFKEEKSIFNVQLVLADEGNEFCLVVEEPLNLEVERNIRKRLEQLHPILRNLPFKYVTDLSTNRAGKRRWIVDKRKLNPNSQITI
ncbi:hypothetical protein FJR41_004170 [Dolichospermum planctonicum UHCC 0167]|uniref:hypothetical protein n=1 Tax=Dolichospermum planctonicum TaxID=136072 RepID=UPI001443343C|nr:hypothetical protein [Dolichospermum planctonicum]MCW9680016.1 hypothetical protein [Dolichospermum planctonicum UHCC 0167]